MNCAPILIPTLNRYEHLRKCLESLSLCTLADQTEVYIALDFPPSDKYIDGWIKNRNYLYSIGDMCFKRIHLIERAENYGTWKSGDKGNAKCLIEEISKKYSAYIYTEDDNIFSPNFLEFINKGIELFENDDTVFAISGYRWWFPIMHDTNTFFRQSFDYTPWGVARWVRKDIQIHDCSWFKSQITLKNIINLFMEYDFQALGALFEFACKKHKDDILIDQHFRVIMALNNQQMIIPTTQLVQNIGLDGSGTSMPLSSPELKKLYETFPLSTKKHFEYIGTGYEYFESNNKIYKHGKEWQGQVYYFIKMLKKMVKYFFIG